ncbi:hypothetical protein V9K67_04070 [Paraflavisolibacter sp. H34]|uniref:CdiA C-terminal domain-containing protein n=1 Tax=Huijunlia imazamoxiresistens TaxID=3127457 RepID=UPI00301914A5
MAAGANNYITVYESQNGGWVLLHPLHGAGELRGNLEAARILADEGCRIQLLPTIAPAEVALREALLPDVCGNKNPDVRINGSLIGDIKTPAGERAVRQCVLNREIYSAARQGVAVVILNLFDRLYTVQDVRKGIVGALQPCRNRCIQQVWVITRGRHLFIVPRPVVFDDRIYEPLHRL